jgi:heterodisulfide reductase subunit B
MALGFYPGCSLKGSSREYNESVLAISRALDIQLNEISDWNCCGATAAHNLNRDLALSLPARILALAEKDGFDEIVVPCAACYSRLASTLHEINHSGELKKKIGNVIGMELRGDARILNVIQFLEKHILPKLEGRIVNTFNHKVACYYGCLLVRPHSVLQFDREEEPQTMDVIMTRIGAAPIDWAFKTECCGAGLSVSRTNTVSRLSGNILKDAGDRGAEAIVVACPMCQSNLDMRRTDINRFGQTDYKMPVIYITQAVGIALGLTPEEVGFQRHFVKVEL